MFVAALLAVSPAAMADDAPGICKNLANYAAQMLGTSFQDGTFADGVINPARLTLKTDFTNYPLGTVKDLGNCDEPTPGQPPLKDSWCQAAGGSPEVYEIDISRSWGANIPVQPFAAVTVTYNRGGCSIDQILPLGN